jgi:catechol 2,3-dioxygenase-like lactoylglutathione lyase family enzyme
MITHMSLIPELKVLDIKQSLDFYIHLAGFKILYQRPEDDFAMLEFNGSQLMIEGMSKSRSFGNTDLPLGNGIHFQIEVADIQKLYQVFKQAGYPIFFEMEEKWYRTGDREKGHKQFLVQDPSGYLFRFFEQIGERFG